MRPVDDDNGGGDGFSVHPGELAATGRAAQKQAVQVPQGWGELSVNSKQAAAEVRGFQTEKELPALADAWHAVMNKLRADMNEQGGNLIHVAETYRRIDDENAGEVHRAMAR